LSLAISGHAQSRLEREFGVMRHLDMSRLDVAIAASLSL
jgi:hypothetical protein